MYCQVALCLVLAAGAYAHGMNSMGMMGGNQGGMNGNMGMLSNLLQGHNMMGNNMMGNNMMGNNMMGNNMIGNMGMGGSRGMMGPMLMTMLQSMMQQHQMGGMGGMRGGDSSESSESSDSHSADSDEMPSKDDMRRLEDMMKMEFAMEVARFVMVYQEYETKMNAFKEAMEGLCLGVEASFEHAKRNNISANATFEAEVNAIGERIDAIEDKEMKINELVKVIDSNEEAFGYGFFKVATMACTTGDEYMKAAEKMERMDRGNGDCEECKDKKK